MAIKAELITMNTKLLTKKDVAAMLQVSTRTIENLVRRRDLPVIRLGARLVRFEPEGIVKAVRNHTVNGFEKYRSGGQHDD